MSAHPDSPANPHRDTTNDTRDTADTTTTARGSSLPAPQTSQLRATLDGRWAAARDQVRNRITADMLAPLEATRAEHRDKVLADLRMLAADHFSANAFKQDDGGTGDTGAALTAFEMLAYVDMSTMVKAGVQWGLWGGAIAGLGSAATRRELLPGTIDVSVMGCFAMTEIGGGSDVQNLRTEARFDPGTQEFVIHSPTPAAQKAYIGGAARDARYAAVFAQLITAGPDDLMSGEEPTSHGVHCFVVPIRDEHGTALPGITIGDHGPKGGLAGVDNGTLLFDHVRVPRTALLSRFGDVAPDGEYFSPIESPGRRFFTMLGSLIRGRVSVGGAAGAAARVALALATAYAARRRQFEHPDTHTGVLLLDYRVHQRRLMPHIAQAYAYAIAQNALVESLHAFEAEPDSVSDTDRRMLETHSAGMKATVSAWANEAIGEARLMCGGAGYMAENRITTLAADTDVFSTFEGDNVVLTQLVAKEQLTAYADEFGDMDPGQLIGTLISSVGGIVHERVHASTLLQKVVDSVSDREVSDLRERGTQLKLLADREEHLIETAAQRLRRAKHDSELSAFDTFNNAQDHVLEVGRAHMDVYVFERFVEAIDACTEPDTRAVLSAVCDLYFFHLLERNKAWYLEHNRLTSERTKNATTTYNRLCRTLAVYATDLVDAFGIPACVLDVPMLRDAGVDAP